MFIHYSGASLSCSSKFDFYFNLGGQFVSLWVTLRVTPALVIVIAFSVVSVSFSPMFAMNCIYLWLKVLVAFYFSLVRTHGGGSSIVTYAHRYSPVLSCSKAPYFTTILFFFWLFLHFYILTLEVFVAVIYIYSYYEYSNLLLLNYSLCYMILLEVNTDSHRTEKVIRFTLSFDWTRDGH